MALDNHTPAVGLRGVLGLMHAAFAFRVAQEVETGTVTLRTRMGGQLGAFTVAELAEGMRQAVTDSKELHEILEKRAEEAPAAAE